MFLKGKNNINANTLNHCVWVVGGPVTNWPLGRVSFHLNKLKPRGKKIFQVRITDTVEQVTQCPLYITASYDNFKKNLKNTSCFIS